jgi:hypothetical protein
MVCLPYLFVLLFLFLNFLPLCSLEVGPTTRRESPLGKHWECRKAKRHQGSHWLSLAADRFGCSYCPVCRASRLMRADQRIAGAKNVRLLRDTSPRKMIRVYESLWLQALRDGFSVMGHAGFP